MSIALENISFFYDKENVIFSDINISLHKGNVYAIMGLSGSGKSTLLNIISGLQRIQSGKIYLNGKDITLEEPHLRHIGYVFQDYGLFPNLTVKENIEFGIKAKFSKEEIKEKLNDVFELTRLQEQIYANVNHLSGGQKQRVALARTLVTSPKVLLLDEVFSAVDNNLRNDIRKNLKGIIERANCTTLLVSHSFDDVCHLCQYVFFIINKKIVGPFKPIDLLVNPFKYSISKLIGLNNVIENKNNFSDLTERYLYIPDDAFENYPSHSTIETNPTNDFVIKNGIKWFEYEFYGDRIYSLANKKYINKIKIVGLDE